MADLSLFGGSLKSQLIIGGIVLGILWLWLFLYKTETALRILFGIFRVISTVFMALINAIARLFKRR